MRSRPTRSANLASLSCGGDDKQVGQEVPECPSDDDHEDERDEKSLSEANDQGEKKEAVKVPLAACNPAASSLQPTVVKEMEDMFFRLGFNQAEVLKLVEDQGIDSPWTLASLSDEDITAICDMINRPSGLVSGKTLDRGNPISVLAAKNLKLVAFLFMTMALFQGLQDSGC